VGCARSHCGSIIRQSRRRSPGARTRRLPSFDGSSESLSPRPSQTFSGLATPALCLVLTLREALSLGQHYIGPEHLLLGLLGENEGVATLLGRVRQDEIWGDRIPRRDQDAAPGRDDSAYVGTCRHTPLTGPTLATTQARPRSASSNANLVGSRIRVISVAPSGSTARSLSTASTRAAPPARVIPLPRLRSSARGARGRPSWYRRAARRPASGRCSDRWFVRCRRLQISKR
jgi:hypothetical protein